MAQKPLEVEGYAKGYFIRIRKYITRLEHLKSVVVVMSSLLESIRLIAYYKFSRKEGTVYSEQ